MSCSLQDAGRVEIPRSKVFKFGQNSRKKQHTEPVVKHFERKALSPDHRLYFYIFKQNLFPLCPPPPSALSIFWLPVAAAVCAVVAVDTAVAAVVVVFATAGGADILPVAASAAVGPGRWW